MLRKGGQDIKISKRKWSHNENLDYHGGKQAMKKLFLLTLIIVLTIGLIFSSCTKTTTTPSSTPASTSTAASTTTSKPVPTPVSTPASTTTSAPEAKTLQIGFIAALTGLASGGDVPYYHGGEIAADIFNERGGLTIGGQKYNVKLVVEDDKSTVDGTVAAANKLVYDDNLKYIAGTGWFLAAAAKTVCEPAKVLRSICFNTATPGELGPDTPYAFAGGGAATLEVAIAGMEYIKQAYPEVKTIVEVHPDDGSIPYVTPHIKDFLEQRGLTSVGIVSYANETVDFSPIVAKLLASNADAILQVNGFAGHTGTILKGLREGGSKKLYAMACTSDPAQIIAVSGTQAATNAFVLCPLSGAPGTPPLLTELNTRSFKLYHQINALYATGFNAVWTLLNAMQAAQSLDPTTIRDTWEKLDTIDTVYGTGWMDGQETYGIKHAIGHKMPVALIDNGQAKFGTWVDIHVP